MMRWVRMNYDDDIALHTLSGGKDQEVIKEDEQDIFQTCATKPIFIIYAISV
jgi:hypothetical protein